MNHGYSHSITTICLQILIVAASNLAALSPLSIEFSIQKAGNGNAQFVGSTNLPTGTELALSVEGKSLNFMAQSSMIVSNGKFISETIGPDGGLSPGQYSAEIGMVMPMLQPEKVRAIIGQNGERLNGPLVKRSQDDIDITLSKPFQVSNNGNILLKNSKTSRDATIAKVKSVLAGIIKLEIEGRSLEQLRIEGNPDCMNLMQQRKVSADSLRTEARKLPLEYSMPLEIAAGELIMCVTCAKNFSLQHCNQAKERIIEVEQLLKQNQGNQN